MLVTRTLRRIRAGRRAAHAFCMSGTLLLSVATASTANAQISYSTQGFFSGTAPSGMTCTAAASIIASCTSGAITLSFNGTSGLNLASNTITSLGTFSLTAAPSTSISLAPSSLFFTLMINQTNPSSGSGTFLGSITGTVSTMPTNSGSLIWTPNQDTAIGSVNYQLLFDTIGAAANTGIGIPVNNIRGIDALVTTTVPEPSSALLLGTGLAGMFALPRRKRGGSATT